MMTVLYLCDRKACEHCEPECNHTSKIEHAINFMKGSTEYIEIHINKNIIKNNHFKAKRDAEHCLEQMRELILFYGSVSISDFHDVVGFNDTSDLSLNYGWKNLTDVNILKSKNGWFIAFPEVEKIF